MKPFALMVIVLLGCDGALAPPAEPPAPPMIRHLVAGPLMLVGDGDSACSHPPAGGEGGSASVFCAFARSGAPGGATELWVLDVSRAFAAPVACDGTSPGCLKLTSTLWTGDPLFSPAFPSIDSFEGETLFVHADASNPALSAPYSGPIKAWRPGWPAARTLSSPRGFLCHGHPRAPVGYCVQDLRTADKSVEFDLLGGALDGAAATPLPLVTHVRALSSTGQAMWGAAFSPDGEHLALSTPADNEDVEVLRVVKTADIGRAPPAEVLRGAARWQLAPDGKRLYYLAGFNYADRSAEPAGTLTMVDFPSAANPRPLLPGVGDYLIVRDTSGADRGLAVLQDMASGFGTLALLPVPTPSAQPITIDSKVQNFLLSPDLLYSYVFKPQGGGPGRPQSLVARNDGTGRCPLGVKATSLPYLVTFLGPAAQLVLFAEDGPDGTPQGFYTDPATCADKRPFATRLAYVAPVQDGLVYGEQDNQSGATMTLRHASVTAGAFPEDGGRMVAAAIDPHVAVVDGRYVVFTVSQGDPVTTQGLWMYGPIR